MRTLTKEIVVQIAYLIGIRDDIVESRYAPECGETLQKLAGEKNAKIIRKLCALRSIMMQKYERVDSQLRYEMKNIDRMPDLFNPDDIKWLSHQGIQII